VHSTLLVAFVLTLILLLLVAFVRLDWATASSPPGVARRPRPAGTDGVTMSVFSDSPSVFVAGATGYVGQAVVRELRGRDARVAAHVRPDSPQLETWRERFTALGAETDATPWERETMAKTLAALKPDALFILIGTTRRRMQTLGRAGGDPAAASYESIDYGLTALLVDAAREAGIRPRLVYLSAMGAGPTAKGAYMHARTRAEQTVRESGLRSSSRDRGSSPASTVRTNVRWSFSPGGSSMPGWPRSARSAFHR